MYRKILLPLDGSELAECALPHMDAVARGCDAADVILLRVVEPLHLPGDYVISPKERAKIEKEHRSEAEKYLAELKGRLKGDGLRVRSEVIQGKVAESIVDYARERGADLIVMATHGRSGISRWTLGSVADRVIHLSSVPVLMVRAPGCAPAV
ncbi:MAG TPA: universal stress protein [Dehalococcoidia bacterium]|nr:universal stress protein [Dehalococcoidia bacterium]